MTRLGVLGVGRIGGEVAYLAALTGIVDELALYDRTESLLAAQVLDIRHTGIPVDIFTSPRDIRDAEVCIFAAGLRQGWPPAAAASQCRRQAFNQFTSM